VLRAPDKERRERLLIGQKGCETVKQIYYEEAPKREGKDYEAELLAKLESARTVTGMQGKR
jgi:hypothetical protein